MGRVALTILASGAKLKALMLGLMYKHASLGLLVWIIGCSDDGSVLQDTQSLGSTADDDDDDDHDDADDDDDDNDASGGATSVGDAGTSEGTSAGDTGGTTSGDVTGTTRDSSGEHDASGSTTDHGEETGEESGTDSTGEPLDGYCPDAERWPDDRMLCERDDECPGGFSCDPKGEEPQGCGACVVPEEPCVEDDACADGRVCAPFDGPCSCDAGARECALSCAERGCDDDEVCRDDGHCTPQTCEEGYACGDQRTCDTGAERADAHGCVLSLCTETWTCPEGHLCDIEDAAADPRGCVVVHCSAPDGVVCPEPEACDEAVEADGCRSVSCESAAECACGSCVRGECRARPGVCVPPPPPTSET